MSDWQDEIVGQISQTPNAQTPPRGNVDQAVEKARQAISTLKSSADMSNPAQNSVTVSKCPVAHKSIPRHEMEKDFTTQGKPSNLECPFAVATKGNPGLTIGLKDPIAAEFHQDTMSARSLDDARACGKCPIRFLDKHSPEELAQYFENHKHEIPRSHEICVRRYRQNEDSVRHLDAKYGNMISMIQGLGNKHQAYLPNDEDPVSKPATPDIQEDGSNVAVKRWARRVSAERDQQKDSEEEDAPRQSHFEHPMRVIRVGESPSRPWGISVPVDRVEAASAASSGHREAVQSAEQPSAASVSSVPSHVNEARRRLSKASQHKPSSHHRSTTSTRTKQNTPHSVIFNGPVFIGYPPDQAVKFLERLGHDNPAQ